jgi:ABC-type sugar transport system ATPase subunit
MIEQVGTPLEIYNDPVSYFIADFFGSPSMNLIPGVVEQTSEGIRFRGVHFTLDLPLALAHVAPGPATLGIRPEHLSLQPYDQAFKAAVRLVEPLGKETLLYFDYGGDRPLIAVVEGTQRFHTGVQLDLACDPRRLYLFGTDGKRLR